MFSFKKNKKYDLPNIAKDTFLYIINIGSCPKVLKVPIRYETDVNFWMSVDRGSIVRLYTFMLIAILNYTQTCTY